jgi:hypothetical protein
MRSAIETRDVAYPLHAYRSTTSLRSTDTSSRSGSGAGRGHAGRRAVDGHAPGVGMPMNAFRKSYPSFGHESGGSPWARCWGFGALPGGIEGVTTFASFGHRSESACAEHPCAAERNGSSAGSAEGTSIP